LTRSTKHSKGSVRFKKAANRESIGSSTP
jgi:hypothetical protein